MIQKLADLFLTMEPVKQRWIALYLGVRNLDGHLPAISCISAAINGCHATAGDKRLNPVMIELIAAMESHRNRSGNGHRTAIARLWNAGQLHHDRKSVRNA